MKGGALGGNYRYEAEEAHTDTTARNSTEVVGTPTPVVKSAKREKVLKNVEVRLAALKKMENVGHAQRSFLELPYGSSSRSRHWLLGVAVLLLALTLKETYASFHYAFCTLPLNPIGTLWSSVFTNLNVLQDS